MYSKDIKEGKSGYYPQYMIFQIWFFFINFVFVLVLLALNFLLAVFTQSYDYIMDR